MESFDENLSLAIFGDLSVGNARPACAGRLGLSLGILVWKPPYKIVRLQSFDWKLSLEIFRLDYPSVTLTRRFFITMANIHNGLEFDICNLKVYF